MAFTGDLEHLHIVDIIQLVHTTRKSGAFTVKAERGESRIIFSNGYIVGANHLSNKVRIGSVLVKIKAISREDLEEGLAEQKRAGKDRKPLLATLIELGKLKQGDASKGLKKLIEMTVVELIGWKRGTFTFETEAIAVSPECSYSPDTMEQEVSLDAQMVLMDALRVFDERERDRAAGKHVPPFEEEYADIPVKHGAVEADEKSTSLTAADLGLADLDLLERKIPQSLSQEEIFSPIEIHRQDIKETLVDFSSEEQETFVSFLEKSMAHSGATRETARIERKAGALVLFSKDRLIKHAIMTICKNEGILVFATEEKGELDRIITQCLSKEIPFLMVFDSPEKSEGGLSEETVVNLRRHVRTRYPSLQNVQFASPLDYTFTLQSFDDGMKVVLPKPLRDVRKEMFIEDTIKFLETFRMYVNKALEEQNGVSGASAGIRKFRNHCRNLRDLNDPSDISLALLRAVAEVFTRAITFIVRASELVSEKAIGVYADETRDQVPSPKLKVPLTNGSVFYNVIEHGQVYFGKSEDPVLQEFLFEKIGPPLRPAILLLPVKIQGKTMAMAYGDFGGEEAVPVQTDMLEILADQAGLALENALYRKHIKKGSHK
ncbi:MAG: DUF4388 domain-containing protein [Nitrospirota bacterium]